MIQFNSRVVVTLAILSIALLLSVLAGSQYFGASKDVEGYYYFFDEISFDYAGRFEPLFVLLSNFLKWINNDFSFFVFSITLLSISLKLFLLSKFNNFLLSLVLYLLILFPVHELTQYRASLALGLLYLSFYFLSVENHKIHAIMLFAASVFTHYSVVAFLPFILLWGSFSSGRSNKYVHAIIGLLILVVCKLFIVQSISGINTTLLAVDVGSANIFSSRNVILFVLLIIGVINLRFIPKNIKPFFFISCYGVALWLLFYDIPVFAHRLLEATFMSYFIWISFLRGWSLRLSQSLFLILSFYLTYKNLYVDYLFS